MRRPEPERASRSPSFFTAADYFSLVDRVRALDCDLPIIPGIMPITNVRQVVRFAELSGAALRRR